MSKTIPFLFLVTLFAGSADAGTVFDLAAGEATRTFVGSATDEEAGFALASGDFDGDTIQDLAIGAPLNGVYDSKLQTGEEGEVFIFYGSTSAPAIIDLASFPDVSRIRGGRARDNLGASLAGGDVDGDGIADLVIGIPGSNGPGGTRLDSGAVAIFLGGGRLPALTDLKSSAPDVYVYGRDPSDRFGAAVAIGELDGILPRDLAGSAPYGSGEGNLPGQVLSGETYLFYGRDTWPAVIDTADPLSTDSEIYGEDARDFSGTVLHARDVDGDTVDDLLIGAPDGNGPGNTRSRAGDVYFLRGGAFPPSSLPLHLSPVIADVVVYGRDSGDRLGSAITSGDFDADSFGDFILGVQLGNGPSNLRASSGETYVVYYEPLLIGFPVDLAAPGGPYTTIFGATAGDRLGASVDAGNLNGDGRTDLLMGAGSSNGASGARQGAGALLVLFGIPGRPPLVDIATVEADYTVWGAASFDGLGRAVLLADGTGDGVTDLIGSAPEADGNAGARLDSGEVYVLSIAGNSPPVAVATVPASVGCGGGAGATVPLDGSLSYDLDSSPGTNDDIVLFEWFEDFGLPTETPLGTGETLDVVLPTGTHVITLRVTDTAAATDTATASLTVFSTPGEAGPLWVLKLGLDGADLGLQVPQSPDPCASAVRFYRGTLPIDVDRDGDPDYNHGSPFTPGGGECAWADFTQPFVDPGALAPGVGGSFYYLAVLLESSGAEGPFGLADLDGDGMPDSPLPPLPNTCP